MNIFISYMGEALGGELAQSVGKNGFLGVVERAAACSQSRGVLRDGQ